VLSGFPCRYIELPRPPVIEIDAIDYYDENDALQSLSGSPTNYLLVDGGDIGKATIEPLPGESFPSTACRRDAVTVTYRAGYEGKSAQLELVRTGMTLMIAELYKQRSLSVAGTSVVPAVLGLEYFWRPVR
jgi:hypothetical protein